MRHVVIARAGGYDRLRVESAPDPAPGPGEVLVRAEAIGVNYADCIVRMGLYESAKKYVGWPITPGFELAGTVEAVGDGVTDVARGAEVIAVTRFGGYATHVVVPRDQLFRRPKGWYAEASAGFAAVFLTAYYALFDLGAVRAGPPRQTVLVHSAAGGVGGALLQLGRLAGARMVGVVGQAHKVAVATGFGADAVIDKSSEDLWRMARRHAPDGYDVVLDANGVETLRESYRHLGSPGRLVIYGFHTMMPRGGASGRPRWGKLALDWAKTPRFDPLAMTNENRSVLAFNLSYLFERKEAFLEAMEKLLGWADEGKLVPPRATSFPLAEVAEAHRAIESGSTVGKLVLVP
jgi:NADPH:quinone reductase-like Zn-dependent oxidoreductase